MLHAYMHMAGCKNTGNWVPFLSELEQYRKYCMAKMTCTDQAMAFRILSSQPKHYGSKQVRTPKVPNVKYHTVQSGIITYLMQMALTQVESMLLHCIQSVRAACISL